MRYNYSELGIAEPGGPYVVWLAAGGDKWSHYVSGLDDPRILPGSVDAWCEGSPTGTLELVPGAAPTILPWTVRIA
jgi:hypothetical protein